jgi:hypothetical protein
VTKSSFSKTLLHRIPNVAILFGFAGIRRFRYAVVSAANFVVAEAILISRAPPNSQKLSDRPSVYIQPGIRSSLLRTPQSHSCSSNSFILVLIGSPERRDFRCAHELGPCPEPLGPCAQALLPLSLFTDRDG